jgi:hypothetical protein
MLKLDRNYELFVKFESLWGKLIKVPFITQSKQMAK